MHALAEALAVLGLGLVTSDTAPLLRVHTCPCAGAELAVHLRWRANSCSSMEDVSSGVSSGSERKAEVVQAVCRGTERG